MTTLAELEATIASLGPPLKRYAVLVNPADVLPDRTFSEAAHAALARYGEALVGLPLHITDGAPVGDPWICDIGALEQARRALITTAPISWPEVSWP